MPQTLGDGAILLDAFPFDSSPELVTDINGYLKGDRSVDAWTMRYAFRQFFSNGVFGTPGDSFTISKAPTGLAVIVKPGCCVINGGMGGVLSDTTLPLGIEQAAGNTCYGIFLRYDDASYRGIALVAREGTAGAAPKPPEPYDNGESVTELRLGYVMLPNGATDMSNATITNERGTSVCPFAAPFDRIDLSSVVADATSSAAEALQSLLAYFERYRDTIDAALSDEEATYLQQQINSIRESMENVDLEGSVDNVTIEYAEDLPSDPEKKLRVKDGSITEDKLAMGVDRQGGLASFDNFLQVMRNVAVMNFDLSIEGIRSDQKVDMIVIWSFPDDATQTQGSYSSSGKYYYCETRG